MTLLPPTPRTFSDDLKLGTLTAFSAGMINVASVILFFAFTSNVTGHYAILAEEVANGKWYQVFIVFLWILLFFAGSFVSHSIILHFPGRMARWARAIPLLIEIACLTAVGLYGQFRYQETLMETEIMVALLLFSMGLQNGLTASISNSAVKTTHLTGLTTDLAIHLSMATRGEWRRRPEVRDRILLMSCIALSYLAGGVIAGSITALFHYRVFLFIGLVLMVTLVHEAWPRHAGATRRAPSIRDIGRIPERRAGERTRARTLEPT